MSTKPNTTAGNYLPLGTRVCTPDLPIGTLAANAGPRVLARPYRRIGDSAKALPGGYPAPRWGRTLGG